MTQSKSAAGSRSTKPFFYKHCQKLKRCIRNVSNEMERFKFSKYPKPHHLLANLTFMLVLPLSVYRVFPLSNLHKMKIALILYLI